MCPPIRWISNPLPENCFWAPIYFPCPLLLPTFLHSLLGASFHAAGCGSSSQMHQFKDGFAHVTFGNYACPPSPLLHERGGNSIFRVFAFFMFDSISFPPSSILGLTPSLYSPIPLIIMNLSLSMMATLVISFPPGVRSALLTFCAVPRPGLTLRHGSYYLFGRPHFALPYIPFSLASSIVLLRKHPF